MSEINVVQYHERLNELEVDLYNKFDEVVKRHTEFNFLHNLDCNRGDKTDNWTEDDFIDNTLKNTAVQELPCVEFRNDVTGNILAGYVSKVDKNGIHLIEVNDEEGDTTHFSPLGFSKLADTEDRIALLSEINDLI